MKRSRMMATIFATILTASLMLIAGCSSSSASSTASSESATFSQLGDTALSSAASSSASANESPLAKELLAEINPIVKQSGMDIGVCGIDLSSGARVDASGDTRMVAASMIKLAVAACFLEEVESGKISLDDTYTLKDTDIVGGTGSLGGRGAGAETTYDEILEMMIAESDNTAANILIDEVGMEAVNSTAKALGLKSTQLNRLMMDEEAIEKGIENYTSANDVATVLELAYDEKLVSPKASKTLIAALKAQEDDHGISAGLPAKARFAHKTGSLANAQHDGGIVYGDRDFILVTMCGGEGFTQDGAFEAMEEIGKAVYQCVESQG